MIPPGRSFSTAAELKKVVKAAKFYKRPWLARGVVTLLISTPGYGKSFIAADVSRRLLCPGVGWFDGEPVSVERAGPVIWCDTEAGQAILSERIETLKIPLDRFLLPFRDPLQEVRLDNDDDLCQLEALVKTAQPVLVVVDSLRGSHKQEENDSRMQGILHSLARIAEAHNVAVLVIHHTNKPVPGEPDIIDSVNRSRGSSAIAAQSRIVWALDQPDPQSDWLRLHIIKNNLGRTGCAIGVRAIEQGVEWRNPPPQKPHKPTRLEEAMEFLLQTLGDGIRRPMKEVEKTAGLDGIATMTLRRAAKQLKVERTPPDKDHNYWMWSMPVRYVDLKPGVH